MQLRNSFVIINFVIILVAGDVLLTTRSTNRPKFYRTYKCTEENRCRRTSRPVETIDSDYLRSINEHTSLEACRIVCNNAAGLWPIPRGTASYGKNYVEIDPLRVHVDLNRLTLYTRSFLTEVVSIFLMNVQLLCDPDCERANSTVTIPIGVRYDDIELGWDTDESYTLQVITKGNEVFANIVANTIFGARHALETLSQLIVHAILPSGRNGLVILNEATIHDSPAFPHRGLLIDTARNFLPLVDILRTIDALASTKMNVLHWHATDSQSFPLEIKSRPSMALYGAYSADLTYSAEDLGQVVRYAKFRGVRIILEIDSPSHVGAGWEWGASEGLGDIAVCVNRQPWRDFCIQPPCGQINPVNPSAYVVLRDIYRDVLEAMGTGSVIHAGGDEVFINCWNSTPEIVDAMASHGMKRTVEDFYQLWAHFHNEQKGILDGLRSDTANDSVILWSSALTNPEVIGRYLDKSRFVVQTWVEAESALPSELLRLGYRIIMSTKNAWYLDHGFWGRTRYHTWRDAYNNLIPRVKGVLGGEACMWGEYVNKGGLDTRIWPRAAAVAERLWSDPSYLSFHATNNVEPRLQSQKMRFESRGIFVDALTPEWCNQHEGMCI